MADEATAREHVVEFPLRTVRVIWIGGLARRDAADLHIERVPFAQIRRLWLAAQFLRNLFACAAEFSLRRRPGALSHCARVDLVHEGPFVLKNWGSVLE